MFVDVDYFVACLLNYFDCARVCLVEFPCVCSPVSYGLACLVLFTVHTSYVIFVLVLGFLV